MPKLTNHKQNKNPSHRRKASNSAKILQSLRSRIANLSQASSLQKFLAKAFAGSLGLKVINAGLLYFNSILLARLLGAGGFGTYSYAVAWINLLLIPATLGIEGLIVRENSIYKTKEDWHLSKGLLNWGNKSVLASSILIANIALLIFWLGQFNLDKNTLIVLSISFISLPFVALSRLRQSAMQSIGKIVMGQLPEMLINPLMLCAFLTAVIIVLPLKITAVEAVIVRAIAATISFITGAILLQKYLPRQFKQATPRYEERTWLRSALPMLLIGSMYIINNQTDTIMLGILSNSEAVGIYTVANRGAGLISFILLAVNSPLGPTFASLYAAGEKQKLQKVVTQCCRIVFGSALFIATILIVFGKQLLLLFGSEFVSGHLVLTVLSVGQLTNAFTGSVALLLMMTGYDKYTAIGVSISAILNIILNAVLIPIWHAEGAAVATAASTIIWNIILVIFALQKLNINSTPLGKIFHKT